MTRFRVTYETDDKLNFDNLNEKDLVNMAEQGIIKIDKLEYIPEAELMIEKEIGLDE